MLDSLAHLITEKLEVGPLTDHVLSMGDGKSLRITTNALRPKVAKVQEEVGGFVTMIDERMPVSRIPEEVQKRLTQPILR